MYRKSVWFSADKNFLIIKKYHAAHALPADQKNREKRKPRAESTSWKQEDINRRRRSEKIQRLLLDNFRPGDYYLTLTYRDSALPDDEAHAKSDFEKFKRRLRALYMKKGQACQWIGIIEHIRGAGRVHAHMILPALDPVDIKKIKQLWPHGNVEIKFFGGGQLDAYRLAQYFTKETTEKTASAIMTSRNLLRSEPRVKNEKADTWKDKPAAPAGYEIVDVMSYNTVTESGYSLQLIVMEKINPEYSPRAKLIKKEKKKHEPKQKT